MMTVLHSSWTTLSEEETHNSRRKINVHIVSYFSPRHLFKNPVSLPRGVTSGRSPLYANTFKCWYQAPLRLCVYYWSNEFTVRYFVFAWAQCAAEQSSTVSVSCHDWMNNADSLLPHTTSAVFALVIWSPPSQPPSTQLFFSPPQFPAVLGEDLRGRDWNGRPVSQGEATSKAAGRDAK